MLCLLHVNLHNTAGVHRQQGARRWQAGLHTPSDLVLLVSSRRPGNILQRRLGELSPEMREHAEPVNGWVTAPHAVCCLMRKVCCDGSLRCMTHSSAEQQGGIVNKYTCYMLIAAGRAHIGANCSLFVEGADGMLPSAPHVACNCTET